MAVPLTTYKSPGVYVQEIRKLPPSIAQVDTAIPVFIGYTEKAELESEKDLEMQPTRIRSLGEYELHFGRTTPQEIELGIDTNSVTGRRTIKVDLKDPVKYYMYYAVQMFYANGGGECFVISVGDLTDNIMEQSLVDGMNLLKTQPDPTLILFPDAVSLTSSQTLYERGLQFCNKPELTNFFLMMDVKHQKKVVNTNGSIQNVDKDAEEFRKVSGSIDDYKYGATYYPYLLTSIPYEREAKSIEIASNTIDRESLQQQIDRLTALINVLPDGEEKSQVTEQLSEANANLTLESASKTSRQTIKDEEDLLDGLLKKEETVDDITRAMERVIDDGGDKDMIKQAATDAAEADPALKTVVDNVDISTASSATAAKDLIEAAILTAVEDSGKDLATQIIEKRQAINDAKKATISAFQSAADKGVYTHATLDVIAQVDNELYNQILNELNTVKGSVIMPPSSAMAGAYARVDSTRGVFKSPANVGLGAVVRPYVKISEDQQNGLNVDTKAGKSINAIRIPYVGSGTLVWGARTLAGNDREWRYVSVRRFFSMVEESTKRALRRFVFEPNNRNTWVSVRASIESFLETQWRAGALLGATPEDAYFVKVGMPETFTEAEMLDGFMVVEIGMAVVRPAEFIVLKFSHKFELGQS